MKERTERVPIQTLAERICSLGTGDPCPCCGAALEAILPTRPGRRVSAVSPEGSEDRTLLFCARCSCEVGVADDPAEAAGGIRFGVAA